MTKSIQRSKAPDPERLALSGSEDSHQIALFCWASQQYKIYPELRWMFAIPNGGYRNKIEAQRLRAMGVRRGVSDICLPVRRGVYSGLYCELKRPKMDAKREGQASDDQKQFGKFVQSQGYGFMVCVGWLAARDVIVQYLEHDK